MNVNELAAPQIVCVERQRFRLEEVEMHRSEDVFSLFMPLTVAEIRVHRNDKKLYYGGLRPGMLRLAVPDERTRVQFVSPLNLMEVVVPGDTFRRAFLEAGYLWPARPHLFTPLVKPNPIIASLASAFRAAPQLSPSTRAEYVDGLVQALMACLVDSQHFHLIANDRFSDRPLDDKQFARCTDFARAKLGHKLTLHEWAATLDMDVREFARAFRKRVGRSPYAWFLNRRIDYAKTLIEARKYSLVEIALRSGFSSQSHFNESFRRRVGCSPTKWKTSTQRLQTRS